MLETQVVNTSLQVKIAVASIDASNANELKTRIKEVQMPSIENAKIDLSSVEFIDSSGVGALLAIHKFLEPNGARVVLMNPSPAVLSVLELLRLHRVFQIESED